MSPRPKQPPQPPHPSPSATRAMPWDKVKLGVGHVEMRAGLVNELLFGMRDALLRTALTTQQFLSNEADIDDMLQLIDDNNRLLVEVEHAIVKGERMSDPMAPVPDKPQQEELAA